MEDWKVDFEWLQVRTYVARAMGKDKLPDIQAILFLIGVQELGRWPDRGFSKEEKQDLIHIAVCTLMEEDGFYVFKGRDQDGWPHYDEVKPFEIKGLEEQEKYLIEKIIHYFEPNIKSSPEILN